MMKEAKKMRLFSLAFRVKRAKITHAIELFTGFLLCKCLKSNDSLRTMGKKGMEERLIDYETFSNTDLSMGLVAKRDTQTNSSHHIQRL